MACLNPQRTYFLVTCPRLDPNDGVIARGFAWTSLEATVVVYNSMTYSRLLVVYILMQGRPQ